jgi:hypothetical protein
VEEESDFADLNGDAVAEHEARKAHGIESAEAKKNEKLAEETKPILGEYVLY